MKILFKIIALTVALSAVTSLLSCKNSSLSADDLAYRLLNLYPDIPPCTQYIKNGDEYSTGYISSDDFTFLYLGEKVCLPEWDLIDSFRLIMSNSTEFFEIHIIKLKNSTDSEEVAKLLNRRKRLIGLYIAEDPDFPARAPELFIRGKYLVLLATYDNQSALKLLNKLL